MVGNSNYRFGPISLVVAVIAAALVCNFPHVRGDSLHVPAPPCPTNVPSEVCFGSTSHQTSDIRTQQPFANIKLPKDTTLQYVQTLLQTCIEIEHSTIPLYLTTMYSIVDQTSFAATTMRSVVMEEMLHMVNAANALNAIGGSPDFDHPDFIPKYPLMLPQLNMSADIVWFTQSSVAHYQIIESTPPGGYNASISAAYSHVLDLLTALCNEHGESNIFTGNHSLQVDATISSGQGAHPIYTLEDTRAALLGVADQGGGCPIPGKMWPMYSNISAGPLGGNYSHAARYQEILQGRLYQPHDEPGFPTGDNQTIDWRNVRRFAPNPSASDFLPEQCVDGGSWVVRNESFFVQAMWKEHVHHLAVSNETCWQDCAKKCEMWTIDMNRPLEPCAMWTWRNDTTIDIDGATIAAHSCLLAQGGGPVTEKIEGFMSGCQFGTVCNNTLPIHNNVNDNVPTYAPPSPTLLHQCAIIHQRATDFASNYTSLLVALHDVFNGNPQGIYETIGQMYTLKTLAVGLMSTPDPRIKVNTMGVGPPWEYIRNASKYDARGGVARSSPATASKRKPVTQA